MKRKLRHSHLRMPEAQTSQGAKSQSEGLRVPSDGRSTPASTISRSAGQTKPAALIEEDDDVAAALAAERLESQVPAVPRGWFLGAMAVSISLLVWSFWPSWEKLVRAWETEPDYSHGWFVIPITAYLLWNFRESIPKVQSRLHWGGLGLLLAVVVTRVLARWAYFDFVDAWMIPITVIGLAWTFGGPKFMLWTLPSLFFLFFMIPLPFRLENELSRPLQWIATNASCFVLQTMGQPAIAEGTTILLGENRLEVERACSGLRIFLGVFALSYICALLMRRSWWEGLLLVLASVPIALVSNAARIVATGLCYQWLSGEAARSFAHDFAGYVMIFFAAGLFGLTLWYLRWLIQDAVTMDQATLKRV